MFCNQCGQTVLEDAKFCSKCGKALQPQNAIVEKSHDEPTQNHITVQLGMQLRTILANLGHKNPNNAISKNYNDFFRNMKLSPMNPDEETIIVHFGIMTHVSNSGMGDKMLASTIKNVSKHGQLHWEIKKGEIVITNRRLLIFTGLGFFGTPNGISINLAKFRQIEQVEFNRFSRFTLYGKENDDIVLEMSFQSAQAVLGQMLQVASAFTNTKSRGLVDYWEKKEGQQSMQSYINAHLKNTATLKQAFSEILVLLVNSHN